MFFLVLLGLDMQNAHILPAARVHLPSLSLFEGSARKSSRRHTGDSMLAANINQKTTSRRVVLKDSVSLAAAFLMPRNLQPLQLHEATHSYQWQSRA